VRLLIALRWPRSRRRPVPWPAVHSRAIVDSHDDTTQRLLFDKTFDISKRQKTGNVDIPRMRDGGLDALFFSIWVPSDVTGPIAVKRAFDQIDAVREAVRQHPNDLVLATTAAEIRRAAADRKIAALMGVEGGHMIDDDMRQLRNFAALGVRYMTLTLSRTTTVPTRPPTSPAQRVDRLRQRRRPRDEPAGHDGRHLACRRQDVRRRHQPHDGARHRLTLIVPRHCQPPAQHDRRHAARPREERRGRDD
jgi:hypothetical protein